MKAAGVLGTAAVVGTMGLALYVGLGPNNTEYPPGTPLAEGYTQGVCQPFLSPAPDPCDAVRLMLSPDVTVDDSTGPSAVWTNLFNAKTTKNWIRDNPGEIARLRAFAAAPSREPSFPMLTPLGQALIQILQTRAYVPGGEVGGTLP